MALLHLHSVQHIQNIWDVLGETASLPLAISLTFMSCCQRVALKFGFHGFLVCLLLFPNLLFDTDVSSMFCAILPCPAASLLFRLLSLPHPALLTPSGTLCEVWKSPVHMKRMCGAGAPGGLSMGTTWGEGKRSQVTVRCEMG